jgi:hypothetical protein
MRLRELPHRLRDRKRCRYWDCPEQHPLTRNDDKQVTCPSCREDMGLPPIEGRRR